MNNIALIMQTRKVDTRELASAIGCTHQYISLLIQGKRNLSQKWMIKIAEYLQCKVEDLVSENVQHKEILYTHDHQVIKMPIDIDNGNNSTKCIDFKKNTPISSQFILYIMPTLLQSMIGVADNNDGRVVAILINGDSMYPILKRQDIVLVDTQDHHINIGEQKLMVFKVENENKLEYIVRSATKDISNNVKIKDVKGNILDIKDYKSSIVGTVMSRMGEIDMTPLYNI